MSGPAERDTPAPAAAGLFVHIKKTAGISIRESLEESEAVVCDYGAGGPKTSPVIKQYKYDSQDPYRVRQYVRAKRAWMVGHFPLLEYADLVDCRRIFTFVRLASAASAW